MEIHEFDFALERPDHFLYRRLENGEERASIERSFRLQDAVTTRFDVRLPLPIEEDLRDLMCALQLCDREAPRHIQGTRDSNGVRWGRVIRLRLGVREIERWNETAVRQPLDKFLRFNTGDDWQIEWVPLAQSEPAQGELAFERRQALRQRWPDLRVALCSEGLDSWAGLADQLQLDPNARFLLVTFNSNPRVKQLVSALLAKMPAEARKRVMPVSFGLNLCAGAPSSCARDHELSLRTRGFLFLSGGLLAASLVGQNELQVFENGMGAFNFDFDSSQMMGQATRAVHPLSLALFGRFASALLRRRISVCNPYQFHTKSQMCAALAGPQWSELIGLTFTCGHEHRIKGGRWHCGVCTSCLMRRWSLRAANLWREDTARYVHDFADPGSVPAKKHLEWMKVQKQKRSIERALNAGSEAAIWAALEQQWEWLPPTIEAVHPQQNLDFAKFQSGVIGLLRAHVADGLEVGPTALELLPSISPTPEPQSLFSDSALAA